jgi:hypothetical protein
MFQIILWEDLYKFETNTMNIEYPMFFFSNFQIGGLVTIYNINEICEPNLAKC